MLAGAFGLVRALTVCALMDTSFCLSIASLCRSCKHTFIAAKTPTPFKASNNSRPYYTQLYAHFIFYIICQDDKLFFLKAILKGKQMHMHQFTYVWEINAMCSLTRGGFYSTTLQWACSTGGLRQVLSVVVQLTVAQISLYPCKCYYSPNEKFSHYCGANRPKTLFSAETNWTTVHLDKDVTSDFCSSVKLECVSLSKRSELKNTLGHAKQVRCESCIWLLLARSKRKLQWDSPLSTMMSNSPLLRGWSL